MTRDQHQIPDMPARSLTHNAINRTRIPLGLKHNMKTHICYNYRVTKPDIWNTNTNHHTIILSKIPSSHTSSLKWKVENSLGEFRKSHNMLTGERNTDINRATKGIGFPYLQVKLFPDQDSTKIYSDLNKI